MCVFQVTACLRERGRDGCLSGIQVQQLFCSQNTSIPEHQLKELNAKIDNALQVSTHTLTTVKTVHTLITVVVRDIES